MRKRLKQSHKSRLNLCQISGSKNNNNNTKHILDFARRALLAFNTYQVTKSRKTSSIHQPQPQPTLPHGTFHFSGLWNIHLSEIVIDVAATNSSKYECTLIFSPASIEENGTTMQVWGDREDEQLQNLVNFWLVNS